uniref:Uncharacterized protein n=1 Tax=Anguilla anguilla TaxID=7936 RepID=A0A0E9VWI6_ANGAN
MSYCKRVRPVIGNSTKSVIDYCQSVKNRRTLYRFTG